MVEIKKLAEQILGFFYEADERGRLSVSMASLYSTFEKEASYHAVQRAIEFLAERDLIATYSYSLTAKGRREHGLRRRS